MLRFATAITLAILISPSVADACSPIASSPATLTLAQASAKANEAVARADVIVDGILYRTPAAKRALRGGTFKGSSAQAYTRLRPIKMWKGRSRPFFALDGNDCSWVSLPPSASTVRLLLTAGRADGVMLWDVYDPAYGGHVNNPGAIERAIDERLGQRRSPRFAPIVLMPPPLP